MRRFASSLRAALPVVALVSVAVLAPARVSAQTLVRTITACTPDALSICADLRLTSSTNFFEIGIRTLSATGTPTAPISLYNLVFGTGAAAATEITNTLVPVATGGATVSDPSAWELVDAGDALFLSAWSNRGIGGCVTGPDVDGFGQAATTCGAGQWITFGFTPSAVFDPNAFSLLNFEAVALTSPTEGASCGGPDVPCEITSDISETVLPPTTVPEPSTLGLFGAGLLGLIGAAARRRKASMRGLLTRHGGALSVTTALLLSACSDSGSTPASPEPSPLSSLRPVANNTPVATRGFAWLAPLGTAAATPATFDAAAAPAVEICVWTANACVGAPVARFFTTPVSSVLSVTANSTVGQYEANWSLLSTAFTSRRTYRIRTLQTGVEIGAVSVDVVRGRWALTRTDGTLAPLVAASALPIRFAIARSSGSGFLPAPTRFVNSTLTVNAPNTNGSAMSVVFDGTQGPTATVIGINNARTTGALTTIIGRFTTAVFSLNGDVTWRMKEDDNLVRFVRTSTTPSMIANGLKLVDQYAVLVNDGGEIVLWTWTLNFTLRPTVVVAP